MGEVSPPNGDDIRTLFLSGLPEDVKEREIHNLFRLVPGYEGCKLNLSTGKHPVAFASFLDRAAARNGQNLFQGIRFDPSLQAPLRVEFAKSNSKIKRLLDEPCSDQDSKRRRPETWRTTEMPPGVYYPEPTDYPPGFPYTPTFLPEPLRQATFPAQPVPPLRTLRKPCSTLYVAGIDPSTNEGDLIQIFSGSQGFKKLKLTVKEGSAFAFIEFEDVDASTVALNTYNGMTLANSTFRIEFAKSQMGTR
eukprot:TRINITY_DN10187_c0_g2_i12.p1 TRINITY_DN10187_c0_g2~~TRINITY_DN10187_c0_g2_i12.p1  ORF type:complete len:249 (-),score=37.37 TRINITY_DN10187_c0_g2_i12:148-894(-)